MAKSGNSKSFISKSRFKMATECPLKPYFSVKPEYGNTKVGDDFLKALAKGGFQVGELACWYLPGGVKIDTLDYVQALKETEKLMSQEKAVIYEAAIKFENLFIRADILVKDGKSLTLYEVKAKSFDGDTEDFYKAEKNRKEFDFLDSRWTPYFFDVAFQDYVIQKAYPDFTLSSHLYLIDKSKVASVEGLNQKFLIREENGQTVIIPEPGLKLSDLGDEILTAANITDDVRRIQRDPKFWDIEDRAYPFVDGLKLLSDKHAKGERVSPSPSRMCKDCEFRLVSDSERALGKSGFDECWSEILQTKKPPQELLSFDLWRIDYRAADKFIDEKKFLMSNLDEEDIAAPKTKKAAREKHADGWEDFERRRIQLRKTNTKDLTREVLVDPLAQEISQWKFPLHFIDFETTRVAIPFHKGMRPYEQIAFQFSHHIMHEDGTIEHKDDWINTERGKFPNFDFLSALKKSLSTDSGTIFRYASHENTVLCEIMRQLEVSNEKDRAELIAWAKTITYKKAENKKDDLWRGEREMVDLLEVVKRYYYHPLMGSSNSIKAVLPAILSDSEFLKKKYSSPIYGTSNGIKSRNFTELDWHHKWVTQDSNGKVIDPYKVLKSLCGPVGKYEYEDLERIFSDDEVADGGAAMTAYAMMQFTQMSEEEKNRITHSLLRYCELDTLAMVMLYEYWCEIVDLRKRIKEAA